MKALVKTRSGVGNVELIDVSEPACPANRVKIDVQFTGICGTDLHVFQDRFPNYPPVILGHEFSGIVHETGVDVKSVRPVTASSCYRPPRLSAVPASTAARATTCSAPSAAEWDMASTAR